MFGVEDFSQKIVDFENFDISQFGTAAAFGGSVLLIGMLTIFSVLIIIWICLALFKVFFHDLPSKKNHPSEPVAPVVEKAPEREPAEGEIVAVIAAAIAMAESENSDMKFRVVSFKRK